MLKSVFFRRKIVLLQKRGGDIWYCVPHLQNSGGGGQDPPVPPGISAHGTAFRFQNFINIKAIV